MAGCTPVTSFTTSSLDSHANQVGTDSSMQYTFFWFWTMIIEMHVKPLYSLDTLFLTRQERKGCRDATHKHRNKVHVSWKAVWRSHTAIPVLTSWTLRGSKLIQKQLKLQKYDNSARHSNTSAPWLIMSCHNMCISQWIKLIHKHFLLSNLSKWNSNW